MVATPLLDDPNFDRTVIVVVEHGHHGALGLVLNRPSETHVGAALPAWATLASTPAMLFVGGPVSREAVIALARVEHPAPRDWYHPIGGDLGVLDLSTDAEALGAAIRDLRVFTGYAGWGRDQLEAEIGQGAWFVVDAVGRDPFTPEPGRLWRDVLRRQPHPVRRFALYPADPSTN